MELLPNCWRCPVEIGEGEMTGCGAAEEINLCVFVIEKNKKG
jgi:hypothetical protein